VKRKNLLIIIITAVVLIAIATTIFFVTLLNQSRNAAKKDGNQVDLFKSAYGVLMSYLSDEELLPRFTRAEIVEEHVYGYMDDEDLKLLVNKLSDIYPYPISISRGHDRYDTQTPYADRDFVYVYLSASYKSRTGYDSGFNTVKIEGFVNDSEHPVIMYFRYRYNEWNFVKAELWEYDWNSSTSTMISSK